MNATISDQDESTVEATFEASTIQLRNAPLQQKLSSGFGNGSKWSLYFATGSLLVGGAIFRIGQNIPTPLPQVEAIDWKIISTMCGVSFLTLAMIGLIVSGLYYWLAKRTAGGLKEMQEGRYVALWRCEKEQWEKFVAEETTESRLVPRVVGWGSFGVIAVSSIVLAFVFQFFLIGLIGTAFAIAVGLVGGYVASKYQAAKMSRWLRQPWFTVIGDEGVYFDNRYQPYSSFYGVLCSTGLLEKTSGQVLQLTFQKQTNNGCHYTSSRVPVPAGREAEARTIVELLGQG